MRREVRDLLRDVAAGDVSPALAIRAKELLARKKRRPRQARAAPSLLSEQRQDARAHEERQAIAAMRFDVWRLNLVLTGGRTAPAGACDAGCGRAFRHPEEGELDHWISRSQGGKHEAVNGWRCCPACHADKTANQPSVAAWNVRRAAYCERAGVPFVARRERP